MGTQRGWLGLQNVNNPQNDKPVTFLALYTPRNLIQKVNIYNEA